MGKRLEMTQPVSTLDRPAKDRILEASTKLFQIHGIRVNIWAIARHAGSNSATVLKYYGSQERLVSLYLRSLIERAEQNWRDVEREHPTGLEGRLRYWAFYEQGREDDQLGPERLLARSAAELGTGGHPKNPLLEEIERYWQVERRRVTKLCEAVGLRDPRDLADKLLLLVHGFRNERRAFGYNGPGRLLHEAADDLLVAHGAIRKPPFSWDLD